MRRLATLIGLTLLLIVTLVANANSRTTPSPSPLDAEYAPGRLLVRFADERAPAALVEALAPFAATVAAEIAPLGVYRFNVPIGQELTVAERLRQRPDVLYAEPDYIFHATIVPNDPHYASRQWNCPISTPPPPGTSLPVPPA
jgi:thermitase